MLQKLLAFLKPLLPLKTIINNSMSSSSLETDEISSVTEINNDPFPIEIDTDMEKVITPEKLKKVLFTYTPLVNITKHLPIILQALQNRNLLDKEMVCYTLATIYVENDLFKPVQEKPSKWSTKNKQQPYDYSNYEGRKDLGNINAGDGELFCGRGLLQITGRSNYVYYDKKLGLDGLLVEQPEMANDSHIACVILVEYLSDRESGIRSALEKKDYKLARSYVNGKAALHWEKLQEAYEELAAEFFTIS